MDGAGGAVRVLVVEAVVHRVIAPLQSGARSWCDPLVASAPNTSSIAHPWNFFQWRTYVDVRPASGIERSD